MTWVGGWLLEGEEDARSFAEGEGDREGEDEEDNERMRAELEGERVCEEEEEPRESLLSTLAMCLALWTLYVG